MLAENTGLKFRLRKIDELRNYFFEKLKHNYLVRNKRKKICKVLNEIEQTPILVSVITGYVYFSTFTLMVVIPIRAVSSAVGLKICVTTTGIKK